MARKVGPGYAWVIAFSGFLVGVCVITGMFMYGYNISYIAEEFGVTVADLAIATSLYGALSSGIAFLFGSAADRIGSRIVITIGMIGLGLALLAIGTLVNSSGMFIVLYALGGAFAAALGSAIMPKLISGWFLPSMRGKGMVIYTLGGSGTGVLLGIVVPQVILAFGWRDCFVIFATVILVCGVIFFLICRNDPASMGTQPLGSSRDRTAAVEEAPLQASRAQGTTEKRSGLLEVLKMPITWLFAIVAILWQFYFSASNAFQTPSLLGAGYDITTAGLVSTVSMACIMVSQVVFASLGDRFSSRKRILGTLCMIGGALWFACYFVIGLGVSSIVIILYLGLIGLVSGHAATLNTILAEVYPPRLRGAGPGVLTTLTLIGTFFGPLIAAAVVKNAGDYNPTAFLFMGISLFAAGLLALVFLPNTGGKYGDPLADAENASLHASSNN